jgi:nucleoside-diphosphate-sugar epimerase
MVRESKPETPRKPRRRPDRSPKHVLVTGWPGFVAKPLLRRLLADDARARATCLVEEHRRAEAEVELGRLTTKERLRVRVATGDVRKMDLGLAGDEIAGLQDVTHVFHLAGLQSSMAETGALQAVNVEGVSNTLALARELSSLRRFVHFSSCFVAGDRQGVILEEELDEVPCLRTPYEESKRRGEKLARAAMAHLPVTVIRPSIVVGDSTTGEIDRFDGVYATGILVVTSPLGVPLPLPGRGDGPLHVIPVDFLTRVVLHLADDPRAVSQTFHVVDPNPLSARMVYELVARRAGKKVPTKPQTWSATPAVAAVLRTANRWMSEASSSLGRPKSWSPTQGIERIKRTSATADVFERFVLYNAANTHRLLAGTDIACPRFDTYVDALVRFVRDSLREERLRAAAPVVDPLA